MYSAPDTVFGGLNCGLWVLYGGVHTTSAARVAMGHWGQCPHIPGMVGHCLVTLGGHTHTTPTNQPLLTASLALYLS